MNSAGRSDAIRRVGGRTNAMIAVSELRKAIGAQEILRGIDLQVQRGETLAIIGRSGGGKSVLLKHHHRPDAAGQRPD